MLSFEAFGQGLRAILANKLRAILTMMGVAIGIAAVLSMVSISDGAKQIIIADLETLEGGGSVFLLYRKAWVQVNGRWERSKSPERLTYDDLLAIERECPSVDLVRPRVSRWGGVRVTAGSGMDTTETRTGFHGTTRAWAQGMKWGAEHGRFVEPKDDSDRSKVAVIGAPVAAELFGDGDPLGQEIKVDGARFTVVGVMADRGKSIQYGFSWGDAIYIPLTTAQQRLTGDEELESLHVHAVSTAKVRDAIAEIMRLMRRRHGDPDEFEAWAPGTRSLEFVTKMSSMLRGVLGCIAAFSLFVGGVGIMNIMLVSVTERTKEIGLRKAVGAHRRDIFMQFLIEAVVICVTGGVLGIALGVGFAWVFARVISSPEIGGFIGPLLGFDQGWVTWPFRVSLLWSLISVAVSLGVGLFFGLCPAMKAAKLSPIEALRRV